MPFSYDINPSQSNRANRRRNTQESKSLDTNVMNTKALGARISDIRYDPNAIDGDGDGLVQEGSPYERPAVLSNVAGLVRGLSSRMSTGDYGYNSEGSWTKGLTNEEIAERVVPDSPTKAVEVISANIGATGARTTLDDTMRSVGETVEGGVDGLIFDEKKIARLRKSLTKALDESPEFRDAVDKFGMPPILLAKYAKGHSAAATMHDSVVMTFGDSMMEGMIAGLFDGMSQRLGNFLTPGYKFKGTKRHTVGGSPEDTIRHEWGHYLNALVSNIHPDQSQRDFADSLRSDSWYDIFQEKSSTPLLGELFTYMDAISRGSDFDGLEPPADNVPWIATSYGQTCPVEFFAESVSAYFSPDKKKRALLNEAGARVVERMLGTQDYPTGGLSSRGVHNQDLSKLSNVEIAELVVPDSEQRLEEMMNELNTLRGGEFASIEDSLTEAFGDERILDFHPERVAMMREHVANMLEANPEFRRQVHKYGMPPVMFAYQDYEWGDVFDTAPQACYSTNGAPVIMFNPLAFDEAKKFDDWMEAPSRHFLDKVKKRLLKGDKNTTGVKGLPDTDLMAVGTNYDGTLVHEWSHYLHDLAMHIHPDEQTRNDLAFFWNRDWDSARELGEALDLMPDGKSQLFDLTGEINDAIANGESLPETTPFVRTWYGQSSPIEMFAEGMTAYMHGDGKYKDLNSQRMNKIIERMFNPPTSDETVDVLTADTSRSVSGLSSKVVKRDANGVRDPSDSFNALNGANWLKDATDEEIADAVVPMNVDDMIEMSLHVSMFGRPDTTDPVAISAWRKSFHDMFVNGSQGKTFFDFSPEGREAAKKIVRDALAESPEFAWAVRQFGLPPIICTDSKAVRAHITDGNPISDMFSAVRPDKNGNHTTGAWATGSFYIALNMASDAMQMDLASGFQPGGIMRRVDAGGNEYITNFGYSRADTLRHEFGHYLWASMCTNPYQKGKTNRDERASYFFPHLATQDGKDRITELLNTFDAKATILSSDADQRAKLRRLLGVGRYPQPAEDFLNEVIDELEVTPRAWSPFITQQIQDMFTQIDPSYIPFPMLNGDYALWSRQELWAEATSLFFSPDSKMRNKYMSDELRGFVARAMGLQVDANGRHERPWRNSGGLSSRVAPIEKRTVTIADNFSPKPTDMSRRDFTPLTQTLVTPMSPSTMSITLGDDKWILDTGNGNSSMWNRASQVWTTEEGNDSMRLISASLMGLGTMGDTERDSGLVGAIMSGRTRDGDDDVRNEVREMTQHAIAGLSVISDGDTVTDKPHSRIVENASPDSSLMSTAVNSEITIPLTSFGDERRTREVLTTPSTTPRALVTLRNGAQVAPLKDGEVATAGVFKVVRRDTTDDGITRIELEHTRAFDLTQGRTTPLRSQGGLASSSAPLRRADSGLVEKARENLQKDLDAKRAEIDTLKDENRRLRLAMEELQATGSWQGEKYDIRINDQGVLPPVTATREELEAQALKNGLTLEEEIAEYVKDIESAGYKRKYEIDQLQKRLDRAQENFDTITKERSDNSFHIEELLAVPEIAEEIRRRRDEVMALSYSDRDKRWSDPTDPDAYYVIHWGASQFVGGELDPGRSRGTDGPIRAGDTRSINLHTARPYVDETKRIREELEATKKLLEELREGKEINVGPDGRIKSQERRILESFNLSQAVRDDGTFDWDDIKKNLGDKYQEWVESQFTRIQEHIDRNEPRISRRERISEQLVADGYQYSSAYNARALTQGFAGYGGRYADEGAEIGAGASSGDGVQRSPITGIHIFRVTPETATSLGGGEDHLIGKHRPIATLVAKNDGMADTNPAVTTWEGWVDMAIQQDIQSRRETVNGLSSRSDFVSALSSRNTPTDNTKKILKDAETAGVKWTESNIGVTPEETERRIPAAVGIVRKNAEIGHSEAVELPQEIKDAIAFFVGPNNKQGIANLDELRTTINFRIAQNESFLAEHPDFQRWSWGDARMPFNFKVAIEREIAVINGDNEKVAKIDDFMKMLGELPSKSDEEIAQLVREASIAHAEDMGAPIIQTPDVRRVIAGRGGVTVHDITEREKEGLQGTTGMGIGTTITARRRVESVLGFPFTGEFSPSLTENDEDEAITKLRPISGHSLPKSTHLERESRLKKEYGEEFTSMYDFPVGSEATRVGRVGKYGKSHIVLNEETKDRTKIINGDGIQRFGTTGAVMTNVNDLNEDAVAFGDVLGMLYSHSTGAPRTSIAGPLDPTFKNGGYFETMTLGKFDPSEVRAVYVDNLGQLRREIGDPPIGGLNPDGEGNLSLIIDAARTRDEILGARGTEVVFSGSILPQSFLHVDNVELFNPTMTRAWIEKYRNEFGDTPLDTLIPKDEPDTTPYEALLRLRIARTAPKGSSLLWMEKRADGKDEETVLKEELERAISARKGIPSSDDVSGLSSRYGRSAKKITKNFRVGAEPRPKPATRRELVNRGVPTNAAQLADILEKSPFSKGKDRKHILDMIDTMEVDWEAQAKLSQKLEKVLADSPGFEELLGEYDIPMMLITKWGAKRDEIWGGDRKRLDINRWFNIEGEYHPEFGIITFPERIANRDYVTNSVSDGPVSTEDVIRHELSHTIHAMAMGRSKKARKAYEKDTAEMLDKLNRAIKDAKDSGASEIQLSSIRVLPDEDHTAAGAISRYAQTKRSEYIAELLTHMLPGKNTKPVILLEAHYEMLSEFLDIPVSRLKELASKSGSRPAFV